MTTEISTQRAAAGLALQTFDDAFRFAKMVSSSEFAPKDFRGKPESCLLAIQHGSEVGLSPMQSLQSIAVINGRPTIWGDAALALVMGCAICEYVNEGIDGEGENMAAICVAKRRGYEKATVIRFSVADAKKAGLWGKTGPWTQYPKRMLQLRARGFALRDTFPDILRGLVTAEEAQDYPAPLPENVKSVTQSAGITVAHMKSFTPTQPQETDVGKAKLAISKCADLDAAERLRARIAERHGQGVFTDAERDELTQLLHHRVEMLIGGEDAGQEFKHEAAEHEVTA